MNAKALLASLCLLGLLSSARAQPWAPEEVSTGAAAVAVLAQKCLPSHAGLLKEKAFAQLSDMLRAYSSGERAIIMDSAEMKVRALSISSQAATCESAQSLRSMALHWGFQNFFASP